MTVPKQKIALGLQYDGAHFFGWQTQTDQSTVQDCVQKAIWDFIGDPLAQIIRISTAGRTDTGVHALGQVVHFETNTTRPMWSWVRGINNFLPRSVVVTWAKDVGADFDARFSAFERTYAYCLLCSPVRVPLLDQKVGYLMMPPGALLRIDAMQEAATYLIGEHDFTCFRSAQCQSKTPMKTIYQIEIVNHFPKIYFFIRANAFLHHMVRNLIGTLLHIGQKKADPIWVKSLLEGRSRALAPPTFSADGLYLARVAYPDSFQIPEPFLEHGVIPGSLLKSFLSMSGSFSSSKVVN